MKTFLFSVCLLSSFARALPSDTVSTRVITPGVVHTQYALPGPFTLDVLEVDLTHPYLTLESYRPNGLTKTTVQSAANDAEGHRVVGAVNGGFFSFETGWPVHHQVADGTPVLGIPAFKSAVAFTEDRKTFIDRFRFAGMVIASDGSQLAVTRCNTPRGAGEAVVYSSFRGAVTGTDASGAEASLEFLSDTLTMNDTILAVVTLKTAGNSAIPPGGLVLSGGSGLPAAFITDNLDVNDTVKVFLAYHPNTPADVRRMTQLISGNGHLIKDGVAYPALGDYDQSGAGFNDVRHPRTFVGTNADTTTIYLCTVDGRQSSSLGMTFAEMADFLLSLGVTNAFNLDGGGSTTMVVRGSVVNSPSDPGGERSVANTFQVISTAPTGSLMHLNIQEDSAEVFQGNSFQFHAEGTDEFLNPLPLPGGTTWSADSAIGTIDSNGLFIAAVTNDTGWVRITHESVSDSVRVIVRVIGELRVVPSVLTMVPGERLTFLIRGIDSGDRDAWLQNRQVFYAVDATNLNVDADGVVTSTGFGSGTVTVTLDTVTQVIGYSSSGADTSVQVWDFRDLHFWQFDVLNTDPDLISFALSTDAVVSDTPAFRMVFNAPPASAAIMKTDLRISSSPDTIRLAVYGDGGGHTVSLVIRDTEGQQFSVTATEPVTWNDTWNDVVFRLVTASPLAGGSVDFPIAIEQIRITLGGANLVGGKQVDTVYVDNLRVDYPNRIVQPQVLFDFNTSMAGWQTFQASSAAQLKGINIAASNYALSAEHPYEGAGCGQWTIVDDAGSEVDWDVRITRTTTAELGSMLRGSYIGAWIWADGNTDISLRTVIRDGNGQICSGPAFPVRHVGWKLIGTRLDPGVFTPYLTSGSITDANNRFNGFRVQALNSNVSGATKVFFVDKMVTSALTVPSGFLDFSAEFDSIASEVTLRWGVNSEISVNRYEILRSDDGIFFATLGSLNAIGNRDTTTRYSFSDPSAGGRSAQYRIVQVTNDGGMEYSPIINVVISGVDRGSVSPLSYGLEQNFPNPFNPVTRIRFSLARREWVTLKVFDVLGREIETLVNGELDAGVHSREWTTRGNCSSVYFYRLSTRDFVATKKMLVLR